MVLFKFWHFLSNSPSSGDWNWEWFVHFSRVPWFTLVWVSSQYVCWGGATTSTRGSLEHFVGRPIVFSDDQCITFFQINWGNLTPTLKNKLIIGLVLTLKITFNLDLGSSVKVKVYDWQLYLFIQPTLTLFSTSFESEGKMPIFCTNKKQILQRS